MVRDLSLARRQAEAGAEGDAPPSIEPVKRYVADTHAVLWFAAGEQEHLGRTGRRIVEGLRDLVDPLDRLIAATSLRLGAPESSVEPRR